jgi:endonuclease YncB( thermonuclease family)
MKKLNIFYVLLPLIGTLSAQAEVLVRCREGSPEPESRVAATVAELDDGDTIKVRFPGENGLRKVRFLSVDTPETHLSAKNSRGERITVSQGAAGDAAAEALAGMIPVGTRVLLEFDSRPCDLYGRHLAYVLKPYRAAPGRVTVALDPINVNAWMAEQGFAQSFCYTPQNLERCYEYRDIALRTQDSGKSVFTRANNGAIPAHEFRLQHALASGGSPEAEFVGSLVTGEVRAFRGPSDLDGIAPLDRIFFGGMPEHELRQRIAEFQRFVAARLGR